MAVWSEVMLSDHASDLRLDSEFYRPEHLELDRILEERKSIVWGELEGKFIVGPFGSTFLVENYVTRSPYRYVRGRDVKPFFLLDDDNCYISQEHFIGLSKYRLQPGDLLASVVGTLGNVSIVTEDVGEAVFSCKSTAFRSGKLDPYYLCAYLNSGIGQTYLKRMVRGHVQTGLNLCDLKSIPIFIPDARLEKKTSLIVQKAYSKKQESKDLYAYAEGLLLEELGLADLDLSPSLFYERPFSEAQESARLDAEFFQPKFYRIIKAIEKTKQAVRLGDILAYCERGLQPKYVDDGEVAVVNTKHMGTQFLSTEFESCTLETWELQKKARLNKYDVLLYGTGAYIGRTNCFLEDIKAIGSNHVTIIRPKNECNPVYLSLFLNSIVGLMQSDRHAHGSAQREIYPNDIREFTLWLPQRKVQDEMAEMIIKAHTARDESCRLLDEAKAMVEKAVLRGSD